MSLDIQRVGNNPIRTPFGIVLPPGGRIAAYVRSGGAQSLDDVGISENLVTTLAQGLRMCRPNMGDTVIVLPGHSESVADATMLDNLVAGCNIVGVGRGSSMPTFRWTATGSQWVVDNANVLFTGLRLRTEGANGVVKAIAVTAAGVVFDSNVFEVASGAALKATIVIEAGAGANEFEFVRNRMFGTATHNVTDGVLIAAAVLDARVCDNEMLFSATAANGCIRVSAAALRLRIAQNRIENTHTSSTAGIAVANVAATGLIAWNDISVQATGTVTSGTTGIAFTSTGALVRCFNNLVANDPRASGLLLPTVDT